MTGPGRNASAADWEGWTGDLKVAAAFLTRVPVRLAAEPAQGRLARAGRAFPLIGAALGLAAGLVYAFAATAGLPPALSAILALTALVLLTGALHEDALADVADGFGGGADARAKLEIMRDSRLGTYGAIALVLSLGLRAVAIAAIAEPGTVTAALIASAAASRAAPVGLMRWLEPARGDGQGAAAGRPTDGVVLTAAAVAAVLSVLLLGLGLGLGALIAAAGGAAAVGLLAARQIGGHTGDVLGAAQQVSEMLFLLAVVALG